MLPWAYDNPGFSAPWDGSAEPSSSGPNNGMTEQQDQITVPLPDTGTYLLDVQTTDSGDYTLRLSIPGS